MKATGVIRRIDELGRIVIPKEIRKTLRIKEGENLEIFTDSDGSIILKKYSTVAAINDIAKVIIDTFYPIFQKKLIITDLNNIIASSDKKIIGSYLSEEISNLITNRKQILNKEVKEIEFVTGQKEEGAYIFKPLVISGDAVGSIFLISREINAEDEKNMQIIFQFLTKYLEN